MSATNEVATNFEVVKHQEYFFIVVKYGDKRYCLNECYWHRVAAEWIKDDVVIKRWPNRMFNFLPFNPRTHYKLTTNYSNHTARIEV